MPSGRPPYAVIVLLLSHISINETQGHELMDAVNDVDAVGSVKVDFDGLAETFFGFENDLSAHTAWADGFSREPVFVACCNGKLADRCGGTLCLCGKDGSALTADGKTIGKENELRISFAETAPASPAFQPWRLTD